MLREIKVKGGKYEYQKSISCFVRNFSSDLTPKLRKKIAEIVLAITLSGSLSISRISANNRKKDKISRCGRYEFVKRLLKELDKGKDKHKQGFNSPHLHIHSITI